MSNVNNPRGFYNPESLDGGPIFPRTRKSAGTEIFKGDLVKIASGRVSPCTIAADVPDGVALNHVAATVDLKVQVYEDLHRLTFEAQCDDASVTGDTFVGKLVDVAFAAGDATTGFSGMQVNADATVTPILEIHKLIIRPDNDYSVTHPKVRVKIRKDRAQVVAA